MNKKQVVDRLILEAELAIEETQYAILPNYFLCGNSNILGHGEELHFVLLEDLQLIAGREVFPFDSLNTIMNISETSVVNEIRSFYLLFIAEQIKNNDI